MPEHEVDLTAEQKLTRAIFALRSEAERKADMISDILDRIHEKIRARSPFRSRMEAFGEIRVSFDLLWEILVCDVGYRCDSDDATDEDVVVDLVLILAAHLCRLLIDGDSYDPAPESAGFSASSA